MKTLDIAKALQERKDRSAWDKGVTAYALEMIEEAQAAGYEELTPKDCKSVLLNGASSWEAYSYGGCSLIYDPDIAERLCTPSELKRTKHGGRRPNSREEWLDTQARALFQAYKRIATIIRYENR